MALQPLLLRLRTYFGQGFQVLPAETNVNTVDLGTGSHVDATSIRQFAIIVKPRFDW